MKVNHASSLPTPSVTLEADNDAPAANGADAQWFSAALNAPEASASAGSGEAPNLIGSLTGAIARNQQAQQSAFRDTRPLRAPPARSILAPPTPRCRTTTYRA